MTGALDAHEGKGARRPWSLWRHRDFMRLWSAAGISAAGSQVTLLALPLTAILALHASAFEVAALSTAVTLPNVALGIPAGVWLDRVRRRPVMIAADLGRALALASIPVAFAFGALSLLQLYAVAVVSGSLTVVFEIASQAYLPSVVRRGDLVEANAKLQGVTVAAQAVGPSVGGALVTLLSAPVAISLDAASFLASGFLIRSIAAREPRLEPAPMVRSRTSDLYEAARYALSHPYLRPLLIAHGFANLALGVIWAIVIVYAVRELDLAAATIGLILSLAHLGGLAGAAFARTIAARVGIGRVVVGAFALFAPATLLLASATRETAVAFVLVGWTLESLARSLYIVSATSVRQALIPQELQARVSGFTATTGTGAFPLGTLLGGALAAAFGLREAMLIAAAASILPFFAVAASQLRSLGDMVSEER